MTALPPDTRHRPAWLPHLGAYWPLAAAVLAGALLRLAGTGSRELEYDEGATGYFALLPWADLWSGPALLEPNPPLFYSLAWVVVRCGGSVEDIRLVSVLAGVLCVPVAWALADRLAGRFAANAAALLMAMSARDAALSGYGRAYAPLTFCLLLAALCLVAARQSGLAWAGWNRRVAGWWCGYAAAATAALYLHLTAAVILAALSLAALPGTASDQRGARRFLTAWLAANLVAAGLFAPWLPVVAQQAFDLPGGPVRAVPPAGLPGAGTVLARLWTFVAHPAAFQGQPWLDLPILPLAALGAWRFRAVPGMSTVWGVAMAGPLMLFAVSQWHPLLNGKTLAWAGDFALVLAAAGCGTLGRVRVPVLAALLLVQAQAGVAARGWPVEGWRAMAAALRGHALPGDTILVNDLGAALLLRHYGWPETMLKVVGVKSRNDEAWFRGFPGGIIAPRDVAGHAAGRVWLLTHGRAAGQAGVAEALRQRGPVALHQQTPGLDLTLFLPAAEDGRAAPESAPAGQEP